MTIPMKVPEVGESIQEVIIAQWLKQEGEWVDQDEDLVEVDSEKASLPLPSPSSGQLVKILKQEGETVEVGDVIAEIDNTVKPEKGSENEEQTDPQSEQGSVHREQATIESPPKEAAPKDQPTNARSPVATKSPTSRRTERNNKQEVHQERQQKPAARPATSAREEEAVPMSVLRRRIATRLVEAQQKSALLTTFNEIDMSAVIDLRTTLRESFQEQYGVKLGFMSFFVKSVIEALKQYPEVNAEIRGDEVIFHNYFDIGVAIGGGKGLVVPVLRNAEALSFAEVESTIDDFAKRARNNKLRPEELTGGTFTISNGGIYGSLLSTPIVNPPQSGVLGMHAIQDRPVALNGAVVIRPMMYVALTYDHRIVDGREAVGFLVRVKEIVEKPARMLLEV